MHLRIINVPEGELEKRIKLGLSEKDEDWIIIHHPKYSYKIQGRTLDLLLRFLAEAIEEKEQRIFEDNNYKLSFKKLKNVFVMSESKRREGGEITVITVRILNFGLFRDIIKKVWML